MTTTTFSLALGSTRIVASLDHPFSTFRHPYAVSAEYAGDANGDGVLSTFEAHSEWNCLEYGNRSDQLAAEFGDNYCASNPDATRELTRGLVDQLLWNTGTAVDRTAFMHPIRQSLRILPESP